MVEREHYPVWTAATRRNQLVWVSGEVILPLSRTCSLQLSTARTAVWKLGRAPSCCNCMPLGSSSIKIGKRNSSNMSRYTTPVTVHLASGKARIHFVVVQCQRTLNVRLSLVPSTTERWLLLLQTGTCPDSSSVDSSSNMTLAVRSSKMCNGLLVSCLGYFVAATEICQVLNLKPIHKQGCVHRQLRHASLSGSSSCTFAYFSDTTECVQNLQAYKHER